MFCTNCGKKSEGSQKFCTSCGGALSVDEASKVAPNVKASAHTSTENPWSAGRIATILIILAVVGFGIYGSLDEDSITQNNEGLASFDSGDNQTAINQLQQASQGAVTNDTKINALKNLAYVYESEGLYDDAHNAYTEALSLVSEGSFDYYLISGEIALLEGKPNAALLSYNKAYEKNPNDFQINNSLALFYIDLEDLYPQYVDYQKALSYAKRAYDFDPEKLESTKQNLAIAHFFNDNYNEAISLLSTSNLAQHPYTAFWLGLAYVSNGDDSNGRFYLQKAVDAGVDVPQEIYDYLYSY